MSKKDYKRYLKHDWGDCGKTWQDVKIRACRKKDEIRWRIEYHHERMLQDFDNE